MFPWSTTPPRTPSETESTQNSEIDRKRDIFRRRIIDTSSAPSTPTGFRHSVDSYKREVPSPPVRLSSFGSDALSCCTPDLPDLPDLPHRRVLSASSSSSLSGTNSFNPDNPSNNSIRSVNLYDLIDEEFVVNCGASVGSHDERMKQRGTSRPLHRRRKSKNILDMIDRIVTPDDDDDNDSSVMTTRSYPRGVFVVAPKERETIATVAGSTVAFVSAEAYNQW